MKKKETKMDELLKYCIREIEYIGEEEVFAVKDLFKGYEWNRLNRGEKINLGYIFKNYIYKNKSLNIVNVNECKDLRYSSMKYKKIKRIIESV